MKAEKYFKLVFLIDKKLNDASLLSSIKKIGCDHTLYLNQDIK